MFSTAHAKVPNLGNAAVSHEWVGCSSESQQALPCGGSEDSLREAYAKLLIQEH